MRNKIHTFVGAIIASLFISVVASTAVSAQTVNKYYLPDEGLINGNSSSFFAPGNLGLDHFNRPIITASPWNLQADAKLGIVLPCEETVVYTDVYGTSGSSRNWAGHYTFVNDDEGNLWFAGNSKKLTRIEVTDEGVVSQGTIINLPFVGADTGPQYLLKAADGTLWYKGRNNSGSDRIVNADFSGNVISSHATSVTTVGGLAIDDSGNAWYSDMSTDEIVKLNLTTDFETRYNATVGRPVVEVFSSNGKVWFSSLDDKYMSYIDSGGTVTNVAITGSSSEQATLSGNYLYSAAEAKVTRINVTDDTYTTYNIPSSSGAFVSSATLASDGSLWFGMQESPKLPEYVNAYTYYFGQYFEGADPRDCTDPTLSASVTPSLTNGSSATIKASNSDDVDVKKVKFYDSSDTLLNEVMNPGAIASYTTDVSGLLDGAHQYSVLAYDSSGNKVEKTASITIDRTKPTASFSAPISGEELSESTSVRVNALDTNGIASVQFRLNGVNTVKDTVTPYTYNWDTTTSPDGSYTISAVVTDKAGNTTTISRSVTVNNAVEEEDEESGVVEGETIVCHFPGTQEERTLSVADSALQGHLGHGDYLGNCITPAVEVITREVNNDGITVNTVQAGTSLPDTDFEVEEDEVLVVNGVLGEVVVKPGAMLKGNGQIKKIFVEEGAYLAPGESPGCLTTEGLILEGTYSFEASGTTACTAYDQAIVKGTVELSGDVEVELEDGFIPSVGDTFVLIDNDGDEAIEGTFSELAEGDTLTVGDVSYVVSYEGGDGNDLTLETSEVKADATSSNSNDAETTEASDDEEQDSLLYVFIGVIVLLGLISAVAFSSMKKEK